MPAIDPNNLPPPGGVKAGLVPPSDDLVERQLLGQCLFIPEDVDRCIAMGLAPPHFFGSPHRLIFDSILRLHSDPNRSVDLVQIFHDLQERGRADQVGGTPYLAELTTLPSATGRVEEYARIVISMWKARQVIALQQESIAKLYIRQGVEPQVLIEEVESKIFEVAHAQRETAYEAAGQIAGSALSVMAERLRSGQSLLGITSGFPELDKLTTGSHAGDLNIIAARPGVGKTALAISKILSATALPPDGSLPEAAYLHSLEMPRDQVALRMVCSLGGIVFQKLRLNQLTASDWSKLFIACNELIKRPIFIDDKPAVTVAEIRSAIRKIKREIELGRIKAKRLVLVSVDYLQLMKGDQGGSREQEVSSLSRGLKNTAKTEKVCIDALAQLNRSVEKRGGSGPEKQKRPELADLRESGAIEQDADSILFIYRAKYYDPEGANDDAELIIAKNRNGPTGTVLVTFDGPLTTFRPKATGYEEFETFGDPGGGAYDDELLPPMDQEPWYNK